MEIVERTDFSPAFDRLAYTHEVVDALERHGIDLYVHAPYIVNVATTNNRIRIPSRKLLQQHVDAAAAIGADGRIETSCPDCGEAMRCCSKPM